MRECRPEVLGYGVSMWTVAPDPLLSNSQPGSDAIHLWLCRASSASKSILQIKLVSQFYPLGCVPCISYTDKHVINTFCYVRPYAKSLELGGLDKRLLRVWQAFVTAT